MSTNREVVSSLRGMIETETQEGEERKFLEKKKNGMAAGGVGAGGRGRGFAQEGAYNGVDLTEHAEWPGLPAEHVKRE